MYKLTDIDGLEKERIETQISFDKGTDKKQRNKTGQFATPQELAIEVVEYVSERELMNHKKIRFLDPAIGTGSFFSALLRTFGQDIIESAMGIEIDTDIALAAQKLWKDQGLLIINEDFTKIPSPNENEGLANLIITNPPYVRHHHIEKERKKELQRSIEKKFGFRINGLSGLYCYFLLLSHYWLENEGLGVWLIPSEFMDVRYGNTIKKYLLNEVQLIHIHRFKPEDVQFTDALVSSSIVVYRKSKSGFEDKVLFSIGGDIKNPDFQCKLAKDRLRDIEKWTSVSSNSLPIGNSSERNEPLLKDFFHIRRGIATGANNFFVISQEKSRDLEIDRQFLKPVLPSPRRLRSDIIDSDLNGDPLLDRLMYLIDCNLPEDTLEVDHPNLHHYYLYGKKEGVNERYLTRNRDPWYKQERRNPSPFLCTYMGRNGTNAPFRFIWNRSSAIATNVYLMMYPRGPLKEILNVYPDIHSEIFDILKNISRKEIMSNGRVYGGGLHKVEPRELGMISGKQLKELILRYGFTPPLQENITSFA